MAGTERNAIQVPESPSISTGVQIHSLDIIVNELIDQLKSRGIAPELPTGIEGLDDAIWGLHRSEVTVIAARPGEGKTTLALQIARNLAEMHKKVLFISLEMTKHQLAERLLIQMTQTDAWSLRRGIDIDTFLAKLTPLHEMFKNINLRLIDSYGYTIPQLQHLLNLIKEESGSHPDVIVVDFIQLITVEGGFQRAEALGEYLRTLKELAMRYRMGALICSQSNRDQKKSAKGEPELEHLKGSGSIEELADCVVMCQWEELGTEEKPQGVKYWLKVKKQRNGPPGQSIPVHFDTHRLTFHSVQEIVPQWSENNQVLTDIATVFPGVQPV